MYMRFKVRELSNRVYQFSSALVKRRRVSHWRCYGVVYSDLSYGIKRSLFLLGSYYYHLSLPIVHVGVGMCVLNECSLCRKLFIPLCSSCQVLCKVVKPKMIFNECVETQWMAGSCGSLSIFTTWVGCVYIALVVICFIHWLSSVLKDSNLISHKLLFTSIHVHIVCR